MPYLVGSAALSLRTSRCWPRRTGGTSSASSTRSRGASRRCWRSRSWSRGEERRPRRSGSSGSGGDRRRSARPRRTREPRRARLRHGDRGDDRRVHRARPARHPARGRSAVPVPDPLGPAFLYAAAIGRRRMHRRAAARRRWRWASRPGTAYLFVLLALRLASAPAVAAVRETSVVIATALAAVVLGERVGGAAWPEPSSLPAALRSSPSPKDAAADRAALPARRRSGRRLPQSRRSPPPRRPRPAPRPPGRRGRGTRRGRWCRHPRRARVAGRVPEQRPHRRALVCRTGGRSSSTLRPQRASSPPPRPARRSPRAPRGRPARPRPRASAGRP